MPHWVERNGISSKMKTALDTPTVLNVARRKTYAVTIRCKQLGSHLFTNYKNDF